MIVGLIFPMFSRHVFSDKKQFVHLANETLKVFIILVVPLIIGTLFLSEEIIQLIGGAAFLQASNTLRILIFALAFIFFGGLFNNILIASNHQKKMLLVLIGCAVFNVSANIIFIPIYSYTASAIIPVLTEFFVAIFGLALAIKYVSYVPAIKKALKAHLYMIKNIWGILLSGAVMALALFIFMDQNFLTLVLMSIFVYTLFLWITKTITVKELASIFAK